MICLRLVFGSLLLVVLCAPSAAAQIQWSDGVVVRPVDEIDFWEHVSIVATRAFIPGARVVAPLHAYSPDLACEPSRVGILLEHDGSAAILAHSERIAFYHRTTDEAMEAAERHGWCNRRGEWYFATTYPLPGDVKIKQHYISRDVDRIEAKLREN